MKWLQTAILLCMVLFLHPIFALDDYEFVSFDPLPPNAEELARAHVEVYLTQRYPEETIVVGEAIPLYVYENEIKALDFILELDGREPLTFNRVLDIYTSCEECNSAFQSYKETIQGSEAWERVRNNEDAEHNRLFNNFLEAAYLSNSIKHIVVAFVVGKPRLIGWHTLDNFLRTYIKLSDDQLDRHIGFGLLPGESWVLISNILTSIDTDKIEWYTGWDYTPSYTNIYTISTEAPLSWSIFRGAFLQRGKEDIPPINEW